MNRLQITSLAKSSVEIMPYSIARWLVYVPFSARLGSHYKASRELIRSYYLMNAEQRDHWIFENLKTILNYSYYNIGFYKLFYDKKGYHPERFRTLEHFQDVPIVTKSILRDYDLTDRSDRSPEKVKLNTGGTSGEVLEFFVDSHAFAREWAHMHWIWERHGYNQRQTKITLRGKNLGQRPVRFNAVHNELVLNAYAPKEQVALALDEFMTKQRVYWVHGYPSLVADFASFLAMKCTSILERLLQHLCGVLLGSEFPAPHYRSEIEHTLSSNIIPWYGHSEMCALAFEREANVYVPLHTYGYCETVTESDGDHLVATSYWNRASPFIRYDTGDRINGEQERSILSCFSIDDGRVGDFIIDRFSNKIGLTALIFGRHHKAFGKISHVQVRQQTPGKIDLLLVPRKANASIAEMRDSFDFSNVAVDVTYQLIEHPIRTTAGKIKLLV